MNSIKCNINVKHFLCTVQYTLKDVVTKYKRKKNNLNATQKCFNINVKHFLCTVQYTLKDVVTKYKRKKNNLNATQKCF
jgi:hypothetical protein